MHFFYRILEKCFPFKNLVNGVVGESATQFPELLHFTLDPSLIIVSVNQGGIKYHFLSLTRPGVEPGLPDHWWTLLIRPREPSGHPHLRSPALLTWLLKNMKLIIMKGKILSLLVFILFCWKAFDNDFILPSFLHIYIYIYIYIYVIYQCTSPL